MSSRPAKNDAATASATTKKKTAKTKKEGQFTSSLAKLSDRFIRKVDRIFETSDCGDVRLHSTPADLVKLAAFFNQYRDLMAFCNGLPVKPLVFAPSDSDQRTQTLLLKAFSTCHMTRRHCFRILGNRPSLVASPPPADAAVVAAAVSSP